MERVRKWKKRMGKEEGKRRAMEKMEQGTRENYCGGRRKRDKEEKKLGKKEDTGKVKGEKESVLIKRRRVT